MREKKYALTFDLAPFMPFSVLSARSTKDEIILGKSECGRVVALSWSRLPSFHAIVMGDVSFERARVVKSLILELVKLGKKVFVIDCRSDYVRLTKCLGGLVLSGDASLIELFADYYCSAEIWIDVITRIALDTFSFPLVVPLFKAYIIKGFKRVNIQNPEISTFINLYENVAKLKLSELMMRYNVICLNLRGLSKGIAHFVTLVTLRQLDFYCKKTYGACHKLKVVVIVDDGHYVAQRFEDMKSVYAKAREFGWGCWLVVQSPREVPASLYSYAGFILILGGSEAYINEISSIIPLSKEDISYILCARKGSGLLITQVDSRPKRLTLKISNLVLSL